MHSQQITWNSQAGWTPIKAELENVSLVFYFGTRQMLACGKRVSELREMFPAAHILGCTTGGQINNNEISDDEIVAAAMKSSQRRSALMQQGCVWSAKTSAMRSNPAIVVKPSDEL